jgi:hypothetical protein
VCASAIPFTISVPDGADPPIRHGSAQIPSNRTATAHNGRRGEAQALANAYWRWTAKQHGKTVNRLLTEAQPARHQERIDNDRRLQAAIAEMQALSAEATTIIETQENRPQPPGQVQAQA